ncbi:hypothetical protein [Streptacidiphilus rugosus]|uniref:hypothetical protein n=1 Tax=Streptacidiphilus rugosus TaxID=405783 RepID=UPI00056415BE|nr:hypothetical protein [Streptacidiphilus rugosus]
MTLTTVGAGIGATLGMVPETSYSGVVGSPTWQFFEPNTITPKKIKTTKQSSGLAGGRMVDVTARRVVVERSATVDFPIDWCQSGHFTTLLNQISSSYTSGAAGSQTASGGIWSAGARLTPATPVYGYTHTFRNSIAGRSAALQMGIPTTDGIVRQYDALGSKMTKLAFTCKSGELLVATTSWDCRYLADPLIDTLYPTATTGGSTQTPYTQATPSYAAAIPWDFANAQIQIGSTIAGASAASPVDGVTGFDFTIERRMKTGRQYYGNAGLKDEPVTSDEVLLTGTFTSDFVNKTYWADAFYSDTPIFAIITFGTMAANAPAAQFVLSNLFLNDGSPAATNKDVVNTSFPFACTYDLTNEPASIILQTADATV